MIDSVYKLCVEALSMCYGRVLHNNSIRSTLIS